MITGVRSALLCESVEQVPDGGLNLLGTIGHALISTTKPGLIKFVVALMLETDGTRSTGEVRVEYGDLPLGSHYDYPPGPPLISAAFPVIFPVERPGPLHVVLVDAARPGRRFRWNWSVDFASGAQAPVGEELRQIGEAIARLHRRLRSH